VAKTLNRLHLTLNDITGKGKSVNRVQGLYLQLSVEGAEMWAACSLGKWYLKALNNVYL